MSYVVIARKYRPQKFADLVGQEHVAVTLKNQIREGRNAQAYLFTGPRGVGKTSAARILAKALRCLNLTPDFEPCNVCDACRGITSGSSLDVLEIDAASNTGVDNIRDLRENVNYVASVGKYRVYIVDEVHMLSTAAFNALLKTIEEPPPHVIFIFATTELHKVPATIQSRCQRFDFRKIPQDVMLANLSTICKNEGITFEDSALRTIAVESEGCLRDAQSLLDQALAFAGRDLTSAKLEAALGLLDRASMGELARAIGAHDPARGLKTASTILSKGTDPKVLLTRLVEFLCDLHYKAFTKESRNPDPEVDALINELIKALSPDEIVRAMDLALRTQAGLHTNIDAAVTVEGLIVKLCLQRPISAAGTSPEAPSRSDNAAPARGPVSRAAPSFERPAAAFERPAAPSFSAPAPSAPTRSTPAPTPTSESAPVPMASGNADIGTLENYIRANKPAWTPVLASILSVEKRDGSEIFVRAKPDFAGKRLSSPDGVTLLKQAYNAAKATVELDLAQKKTEVKPTVDPILAKRTMAREHEAVKAAIRILDATITESKILDGDRT